LQDPTLATLGHGRHGLVDVLFGAGVALVAVAAAQAAVLPHHPVKPKTVATNICDLPKPAPVLIAFRAPLADATVGSKFGLRQLPWEAHGRLHAGVDLEAPGPEAITASADGVVSRMGQDGGLGRFVELTHAQGITTVYGHMSKFAPDLAVGTSVKAGSEIGRLGSTGSSTGAHLHFEIHDPQARPLNPEMLLGQTYATLDAMPLKDAAHVPHFVRVAYVSRIPRSKQARMEARLEPSLEAAASDADSAADTPTVVDHHRHHGRIHSRLQG
jgi:murein DD-endopeptidase MepM/ murein hydrolase activator NlpD